MKWLAAAAVAAALLAILRWMPGAAQTMPPAAVTAGSAKGAATGRLGTIDQERLVLVTPQGTDTYDIGPATVWREGPQVIDGARVSTYRGRSAKVRYRLDGERRVAQHVAIAPERVAKGRLQAYDPATRALTFAATAGTRTYALDEATWCGRGAMGFAADQLAGYIGQAAEVTTSLRTGRVIAVRLSEKAAP